MIGRTTEDMKRDMQILANGDIEIWCQDERKWRSNKEFILFGGLYVLKEDLNGFMECRK